MNLASSSISSVFTQAVEELSASMSCSSSDILHFLETSSPSLELKPEFTSLLSENDVPDSALKPEQL
ncbi:hypothetical protein ACFX1X_031599 [Malus domestica]